VRGNIARLLSGAQIRNVEDYKMMVPFQALQMVGHTVHAVCPGKKMVPRKLCFLATLGAMLVLATVKAPQTRPSASPIPNSRLRHPALLPVQSRNTDELGAGKVLVASRDLGDPNFIQTVVLLVHYDAEGAVGLILNRRTDVPLSRVLEGLKGAKDRTDPVFLGGPVEKPAVFALLRSVTKPEGAQSIFDGVYLISSKALFERALSTQPDPKTFHVYLGYAGWTNDQLREEVELGAWFIFRGDARTVFNADPDSLWSKMIGKTELKMAGREPVTAPAGPTSPM
jgi:putative AlgH/UPF0301 family transcriptional regulator